MKYIIIILIGVLFGIIFSYTDYLASFHYRDQGTKLFLLMILSWIVIAFLTVYYLKRRSQIKFSIRYNLFVFFLMLLSGPIGIFLFDKLNFNRALENEHLFVKAQLSDDFTTTLSSSYDSYMGQFSETFNFSFLENYLPFALLFFVLGFIPIILIKSKTYPAA